jgi:hypothetical protein
MQRSIQIAASFLMDRNPVCARLGELRYKFVGIFNHQVAIERQVRNFSQRLYDRRPDGKIGDKMPIHNIDVDRRSAAVRGTLNLIRQTREIRR